MGYRHFPSHRAGRIPHRLNLSRDTVLAPEAAGDHVVLQRSDNANDRFAAARREEEDLHQPLFFELLHSLVELLVACVFQSNAAEVLGRESRQVGKPQARGRSGGCRRSESVQDSRGR